MSTFAADIFGSNVETVDQQNAVANDLLDPSLARPLSEVEANVFGSQGSLQGSEDAPAQPEAEQGELSLEERDARNEAEEARAEEDPGRELQNDLRDEMALQLANEQLEQQQTPEQALESYQEAIERMDLRSEESGEIAAGLMQDLGLPDANSGKMENLLMVTAMSAARHGYQQISPEVGRAWAQEFYPCVGLDARFASELAPWQQTEMAQSAHDGFVNIESTCQWLESQGIAPTVENVNSDPTMSIALGRRFLGAAVGADVGSQLDQIALRLGDRVVSLYLNMRQRADQSEQQSRSRQSRPAARGEVITDNSDLFGPDAMAEYHKHHGRI